MPGLGGGPFSGRAPSKGDRWPAYAARHVAKNVVAAGLADRAEVQVAYAIGVAHPVSVMIETFGSEKVGRTKILELIRSEEHTSELQSQSNLVCRLLLEKK